MFAVTESHIPTERELDALLAEQPRFDLEAVKRRTLARIGETVEKPAKRRLPLRGLLLAAVLCALSVSAVAGADYVTDGRLSRALGIRKAETEAVCPPDPAPAETPVLAKVSEPSAQVPEPETPELDEQIAGALQIGQSQAQQLRPAVQKVEQTAEDQGVRMTVLQTLGDPACLYIKLRFDFPEAVTAGGFLEFEDLDISLSGTGGHGWQETILERDDRSVTYLLSATLHSGSSLDGQTITVTAENYGHPHEYQENEIVRLTGEAGTPYTSILYPDGTIDREVTEAKLAALPPEAGATTVSSQGFTISGRTDGSKVVSYDGQHGDQTLVVYLAPSFDPVVTGRWEQSWTLCYEDLSLYWKGGAELFDPRLTMTEFRLSPLSWEARFTARELQGEELGYGLMYGRDWKAQLRHQDGSLTDLPRYSDMGTGDSTKDGIYLLSELSTGTVFDHPIDISDVTAVIIDGHEFPVG